MYLLEEPIAVEEVYVPTDISAIDRKYVYWVLWQNDQGALMGLDNFGAEKTRSKLPGVLFKFDARAKNPYDLIVGPRQLERLWILQ